MLGVEVADSLFGRRDGLVGETVRVEGQPFRVLGVLQERGGGMMGSQDNEILIPFSTAQTRILHRSPADRVDVIFVQAVDADSVLAAEDEISQIIAQRHRTEVGKNDFTIFSQQDMVDTASSITGILTTFIGGIAAISLLVGGIGIMNIMLASVLERTREIGIRKALGAKPWSIIGMIMHEAIFVTAISGFTGLILSMGLLELVGPHVDVDYVLNPSVNFSVAFSTVILLIVAGTIAGFFPAWKAVRVQVIEALRDE